MTKKKSSLQENNSTLVERNFKLTIEYDGFDFFGWQIQPQKRTVQGEIQKALESILKQPVVVVGSGRTDTGVHSKGQVAHVKAVTRMLPIEILKALNANLPEDISIIEVKEVPMAFHAQFDAKSKVYRYTILNKTSRSPLNRRESYYYPYRLDLSLLRNEARALLGKKDFKSFCVQDHWTKKRGELKESVRSIKKVIIKSQREFVLIDIEADGFLYKMVRSIVGTLLEVGSGLRPSGDIQVILRQKTRTAAGMTAPACGLCLLKVNY